MVFEVGKRENTYNVHFCVDHRTLEETQASVGEAEKVAGRRFHRVVPYFAEEAGEGGGRVSYQKV